MSIPSNGITTAPDPQLPPNQPPRADGAPEWTRTKLDEGPGWSREVVCHRDATTPGTGAASSADP
jgi:hypothetical protein